MSAVDEDREAERLAEQRLTGNDELRDRWHRAEDTDPYGRPLPVPVDWHALFSREVDYEWLVEDLWPAGRQLHIFASRKTGKSLILLYIAACLACGRDPFTGAPREPVRVIYLDYEMSEEDLLERLEDMGFGPDDLTEFRYYLHPALAPLDTADGGDGLLALVERDRAVAVVVDTVSRVVSGEENSADTFRALWRNTGARLKAAGVALARLDHEGHEAGRSRGSSAKADDVDVVWRLSRADAGYTFTRKAARMAWVPELVEVHRGDDPLSFTRTAGNWPAGTKAIAERLDALGAPMDISRRSARDLLVKHADGKPVGKNEVIAKAIKYRRQGWSL